MATTNRRHVWNHSGQSSARTVILPMSDKVTVTIPAFLLEEYGDGSALVDADGVEMLVAADEWVVE